MTPASARDARFYRTAGLLAGVAAVVTGISAYLPWVTYPTRSGASRTADAFQLGSAISWVGIGTVVVVSASLLFVAGVLTVLHPFRPNLAMPLAPTLLVGLTVANSWYQIYSPVRSSLAVGMVLCLIGIALGLASSLLLLPAEHPRSDRRLAVEVASTPAG